ncbi:MAG TPA: ABC transporter ATP-binding protein, partial [Candidatus Excrementavichristensenella intestinipullorum]|nr:ABC transporter ATP-binding protein [Candidatus Excrementavichristensenella intestinipullorum]
NHGTRLLMMHQGKAVIDASGPDRAKYSVDDLLDTFNQISIEVGN